MEAIGAEQVAGIVVAGVAAVLALYLDCVVQRRGTEVKVYGAVQFALGVLYMAGLNMATTT